MSEVETLEKESIEYYLDLNIVAGDKIKTDPRLIKRDNEAASVDCFVLMEDFADFKAKDGSFNIDLLGNPMYQYVVRACPSYPNCLKFDHEKETVLGKIKPFLGKSEYTLVLFADTPLITKNNVLNILDFAKAKGLNVCKLTRGWVFKTEYIKRVDEIYSPSIYYFQEEDFMVASSYETLSIISDILKNRVITYHMKNGVHFKAPETIYIDANVSIGEGTVIGEFVSLTGDTDIEKNARILSRSTLSNAKILSGAVVEGARIDGAVVMENAKIKSGVKLLENTAIKEGAVILEDSIISNAIIGEHCIIGRNTIINYLTLDERCVVGNNCQINGTEIKPVYIQKEVKIGDQVKISEKIVIETGVTVKAGEEVKHSIKRGQNG